MKKLRLGIVGCGAVAKTHLWVLDGCERAEAAMLVDKNLARARDLADEHGITAAAQDYRDLVGQVDAAMVALPHHLHAPVAIDLLERGLPVLVEKPMALKASECDEMIAAAEASGVVLAVGIARCFYAAGIFVKNIIERDLIGPLKRIDVREGYVYSWPVASDFMFRRDAGGGVLADTGAHTLDTLLWWMGEVESCEYFDDSRGGVDADCQLRLKFANGAQGFVELSRTRELRNSWVLEGERGELRIETKFNPDVSLSLDGGQTAFSGKILRAGGGEEEPLDCFSHQMDDFVGAVLDGRPLQVPPSEGKRSVALIEACHAARRPLQLPWEASI